MFFSLCFQHILFLVFRSLTVMCLGMNFFGLSSLGFTQLLKSVSWCLLPSLGNFQVLHLQILDFNDTNVQTLILITNVSEALLIFFLVYSLCCSG